MRITKRITLRVILTNLFSALITLIIFGQTVHAEPQNTGTQKPNAQQNEATTTNDVNSETSMIEVIADAQRKSTLPLIRYCIEQQPTMKEKLKESFLAYGAKVDEAMTPLIAEYRNDPEAQRSPAQLAKIEQQLMAQVKTKINNLTIADSAHYCHWMIKQLGDIQVESFRAQIREGYNLMKTFSQAK